ncbi:FMN-dependent NADH-azoreductase [Nocardiopsis terrae]|uniref:FMN dependent NADH:quinone oxidoreductase n=1 Tax=Nocardiopsis terrae TaxID=372655 RepID=A0ABR9HMK0_9ACTN|nr:NAD(P)H-dependent oxidoreductase [Nocardiopsis terrae]MBE1460248.1 FMN-dependent NADH-azoreductase [Nocardiopsis terrae]GHC70466.1 FMN-dependent NADH-azoreductase [Nocardiopsis terrae]
MTSLLHLDSSHSNDSVSRHLTGLFARAWRQLHGYGDYRYRDVAAEQVPMITSAYCSFAQRVQSHGALPLAAVAALAGTPSERREWSRTVPLVREVLEADTLLLGVPMYNLTVPPSLKAWIDRITFPGVFTNPETGSPLLRGKQVVVAAARGGGYGPGAPKEAFDFQTPYLRAYFEGMGVREEDVHIIHAELTRAADVPELARFQDLAKRSRAQAESRMAELPERLNRREATAR